MGNCGEIKGNWCGNGKTESLPNTIIFFGIAPSVSPSIPKSKNRMRKGEKDIPFSIHPVTTKRVDQNTNSIYQGSIFSDHPTNPETQTHALSCRMEMNVNIFANDEKDIPLSIFRVTTKRLGQNTHYMYQRSTFFYQQTNNPETQTTRRRAGWRWMLTSLQTCRPRRKKPRRRLSLDIFAHVPSTVNPPESIARASAQEAAATANLSELPLHSQRVAAFNRTNSWPA